MKLAWVRATMMHACIHAPTKTRQAELYMELDAVVSDRQREERETETTKGRRTNGKRQKEGHRERERKTVREKKQGKAQKQSNVLILKEDHVTSRTFARIAYVFFCNVGWGVQQHIMRS